MKHKDTVLNKTDIIVTEFEEQKFSLDNDFKDIEDLIVTSYLKTKPSLPSTISIRETICSQLFPLYRMIRESLDKMMCEAMLQQGDDVALPQAKRVKTEKVNHLHGGQDAYLHSTRDFIIVWFRLSGLLATSLAAHFITPNISHGNNVD